MNGRCTGGSPPRPLIEASISGMNSTPSRLSRSDSRLWNPSAGRVTSPVIVYRSVSSTTRSRLISALMGDVSGLDGLTLSGAESARGAGVLPPAERIEQLLPGGRVDVVLAQCSRGLDDQPHLLDVFGAVIAAADMCAEAAAVGAGEAAVEVGRDELDELLARHFPDEELHAVPPTRSGSRYISSAARTLERARCSRTRWLPSLISSASATSFGLQPSTSRSRMTSRCASGSFSISVCMTPSVSCSSSLSSGQARGGAAQAPG